MVELEPLYFRREGTSFDFVFREDDRGRITYMFSDITPQTAYEKLDWYETSSFHMALLQVCLLIFLSMLPVALVRFIRSRRSGGDRNSASRGERTASRLNLAISFLKKCKT